MLTILRLIRVLFLHLILIFVQKGDAVKLAKAAADWASNIIKDTGKISNLRETEPGFDLSEKDMAKFHIWPSGTIPYLIDDFSFDKVLRYRIRSFLELTNSVTGLHFLELPRPPVDDKYRWVLFINRQGQLNCSDYPFSYFTNEGVQKIVLGYNCLGSGRQLPAVILSLVGVPPQHNAPGRSNVVKVNLKNVMPGKSHYFDELQNDMWLFHDVPYDVRSVSHYSSHKYTVNGAATVQLKVPVPSGTDIEIGESKMFSSGDIWKIIMLYNYIGKYKFSEIKLSGCKKLFDRGSDFSSYRPESEDELEPRKIPQKYLENKLKENKPKENEKKLSLKIFGVQENVGKRLHKASFMKFGFRGMG